MTRLQLETQDFLRIVEKGGKLVFFDTETSGREGDYDKILVSSLKIFGEDPESIVIGENACDKGLVKETKAKLEEADAWVTYFGKGFDIPLLNTRLTRWAIEPVTPKPHIDMYYQLKYKLKTGRHSQAHLLEFLQDTMELMGIKREHKLSISPNVWADLWTHYNKNIRILKERCESDVEGLEALYGVTKHLIRDIKR